MKINEKIQIIGSIIEIDGEYNIEVKGEKLLNKNYKSLKRMLEDLAKNM